MHKPFETKISETCEEPAWDRFLQNSASGQYQQSAMWSKAKSHEGWRPLRLTYLRSGEIAGGFQLLYKKKCGCAVGYVSKGPVIGENEPDVRKAAWRDIEQVCRDLHLSAVIVQHPDACPGEAAVRPGVQFVRESLFGIITSTLLFDLCRDMATFERSIHPDYMRKVRQSRKRGVLIREGTRGDLDLFFELMLGSCRRQGVTQASPARPAALRMLWDAFGGGRCIRLTFAELAGEPIAGQLNFIFGKRVTLFRKGWTSEHSDCRPNHMLTHEILAWAHRQGATTVDCMAMDRAMAENVLAGKPLVREQTQSRDMFNLCFGGRPQLLPHPYIFIPNPALRAGYCALSSFPAMKKLLSRLT